VVVVVVVVVCCEVETCSSFDLTKTLLVRNSGKQSTCVKVGEQGSEKERI